MNYRRHKTAWASMIIFIIAASACNRVPDYVIKPDDMAPLMADIRMADAVISVRRSDYPNDASKMALQNAVLERHGVTRQQFDTSLMWYGHNMSIYQDVTKQSIEILEKRLKEADILAAGEAAMSISGDSVDVWDKPRVFIFNSMSPTHYVTFDYESDPNWEPGDVYTLRARLLTPAQEGKWNIAAVYDDGAIETITMNLRQETPERQELTFVMDSTRTPLRISGWINIEPMTARPTIVDSLSLMRRRMSPALAHSRKYNQKLIAEKKHEQEPADTIQE